MKARIQIKVKEPLVIFKTSKVKRLVAADLLAFIILMMVQVCGILRMYNVKRQ